MKTRDLFSISKATLIGAFKVSMMVVLSIALVALLMTVTSNYASPMWDSSRYYSYQDKDCAAILSEDQFRLRHDEISKKFFEETKVSLSKELLDHYCLSSLQTSELMKLFSFDRTRMDFAEYAIDKVYDPENFTVCKGSFMISANGIVIDDLIKTYEASLSK